MQSLIGPLAAVRLLILSLLGHALLQDFYRLACMAWMASPISQTLGCPLNGSAVLSSVVRQSGEGLVLASSGATYISAVPSSLAAVNGSCLLGIP